MVFFPTKSFSFHFKLESDRLFNACGVTDQSRPTPHSSAAESTFFPTEKGEAELSWAGKMACRKKPVGLLPVTAFPSYSALQFLFFSLLMWKIHVKFYHSALVGFESTPVLQV